MISPELLNISSLPSLPLESRKDFPEETCIYFAIDSQDTIQYIGRTQNLRQRWMGHHCQHRLTGMGGVRIAYLSVNVELLDSVEAALIEWFCPPLNKIGIASNPKKSRQRGIRIRQIREIEVEGLGARIKAARLDSRKSLRQITEEVGVSLTYWYDIESEKLKGALSIENLIKIEQCLGVDFGVNF